ncbi:MAG: malonate transporter [Psychromonas sp.]|jgi:malonate transporter|uniref:AEC family transporter n=1 Tax=Psychromonas sp. TaxID=1884585 RepID=UPI0039E51047
MFLESLMFSLSVTGPICLLLFLGWFLRRINFINEPFIEIASKLVFTVTLPTLLFLNIVKSEHGTDIDFSLIAYSLLANILFFLLVVLLTKLFARNRDDHGAIIQGAFRANLAIIGLAYVDNIYGDAGLALAAVYVAFHVVLYNVLSVLILTPKQHKITPKMFFGLFKAIFKNPLIIGILSGVLFFFFTIPVPKVMLDAGQYFADMSLPMALLCAGGSLHLKSLNSDGVIIWFATVLKIIVAPILMTGGAYLLGFRGLQLGLIFLMTAAPTAAASYVMARAMGANAKLAANVIACTTVGSLLTYSIGLLILYRFNLM